MRNIDDALPLQESYRDDKGCLGAIQSVMEEYILAPVEFRDELLRTFGDAAKARGTNLAEVITLVESDKGIITLPADWEGLKRTMLATQRVLATSGSKNQLG